MPRDDSIRKVMIIGSGPIIIGQAAEFDYSGTQACRAIREEGIETILVNSNPATIMTDEDIADKIYIEPLTEMVIEAIINQERPDGILAGFGGQTALNLAIELEEKGVLKKYNTRLLGININSIKKAEDREEFKKLMTEINEPIPASVIATNLKECLSFVEENGYPVIIRPAYTLGGTGGGIATNDEELKEHCKKGIESSAIGQILLEQSVAGWKEIEYEVMRDAKDNCIIICNMENLDPVGIHTGDSIVVAPTQTLGNREHQMLRDASLKIIRSLKIEGGCNIQFALDPYSMNYIVIEVNPRVSRSSALASKATGYPIAKIAAKIALGYALDELKNVVTQNSSACFEPTIDYCVVKFPKWPFDKFGTASRKLGTQMKATGEVMAISRTFESALLKAITSLEVRYNGLRDKFIMAMEKEELIHKIQQADDERIFAIAEALRRGMTIEAVNRLTKIDPWFLNSIHNIVNLEKRLAHEELDEKLLYEAESLGFTDSEILDLSRIPREALHDIRVYHDIYPVYKMVDTCGGEFEATTPYYYSCYDEEDECKVTDKKKILVVGSGPIRIGQGIEFDYCCVHGVNAIDEAGYESIIVNNNPETVSTDFDISDKLYFEALHIDDIMNILKRERPEGIILQFGGQTSLNLAQKLQERSIKILGTSFKSIDLAEDREKFEELLESMEIPVPKGYAATSMDEAEAAINNLGYPVVVRPSYVIGGRGMQIVYERTELEKYLQEAIEFSTEHPVLIDKYIKGTEIEVDAVADGQEILIPGIMEHIEKTGVHSGDSISVYPAITLDQKTIDTLISYTRSIVQRLNVVGLINIQYAYDGKDIYVIEVNPRASRTVPILSKVTGVPMVKLAVQAMLGKKISEMGYGIGLMEKQDLFAVKVPVFSAEKLTDVDIILGPEMKSTGEVLGIDKDFNRALYKGIKATKVKIPNSGGIYISLKNMDKNQESIAIIQKYYQTGFHLYASKGTYQFLKENAIHSEIKSTQEIRELIFDNKINIVINTPTKGGNVEGESFKTRRKAWEYKLPVLTSMETVDAFYTAIEINRNKEEVTYHAIDYYVNKQLKTM
ncbi:MAG: carbamoyl-phosphate synthase (glutamine-hydrolyzing) large subunit [Peptostreptococcales bacterium]